MLAASNCSLLTKSATIRDAAVTGAAWIAEQMRLPSAIRELSTAFGSLPMIMIHCLPFKRDSA